MKHRQRNNILKAGKRHFRKRNSLISRDFSSVEDHPNSFLIIKELVARAGRSAAKEAAVMGLPLTVARNREIVRIYPNREEEIIETVESSPVKSGSYYVYYKPFTVLHVRKK